MASFVCVLTVRLYLSASFNNVPVCAAASVQFMRVGCAAFYSLAMYQSFASGLNIYQESGDNTRPDFTVKIPKLSLKLVYVHLSSGSLQEDTIVLGITTLA